MGRRSPLCHAFVIQGKNPVALIALDTIDIRGSLVAAATGETPIAGGHGPAKKENARGPGPGGGSAATTATAGGGAAHCGKGGAGASEVGKAAPAVGHGGAASGAASLVPLLGGSAGGAAAGAGGAGGGALQPIAKTPITIAAGGVVNVGGGGGEFGGEASGQEAAGGGSGGSILLEAQDVNVSGTLAANGGGGGSGTSSNIPSGANATGNATPAPGGASNGISTGGSGSGGARIEGANGAASPDKTAGGGGGGAGRIRINTKYSAGLGGRDAGQEEAVRRSACGSEVGCGRVGAGAGLATKEQPWSPERPAVALPSDGAGQLDGAHRCRVGRRSATLLLWTKRTSSRELPLEGAPGLAAWPRSPTWLQSIARFGQRCRLSRACNRFGRSSKTRWPSAEIMDLHPDFKELLAECVAAKVEFAVVGGYAVGFHARPRATKDLDLLVLGVPENLARLAEALAAFGAPPNVVAAAKTAKADDVIYFGVAPLRVDIMTQADGIDTRAALERAVYADLGTVSVPIVGLADLIANKRASGRKQDLADLEVLELSCSGQ